MAASRNRRIVLASRPQGRVVAENFRLVEAEIGKPGEGEVLVRNQWLSLDPYMRGRMTEAKSYAKSVAIGEVMVGQTVGEVIESRDARFAKGDRVLAPLGWQLYGIASGSDLTRIDTSKALPSYYLGILGMPGFTAWFGLAEIAKPKAGETFVVSAASGAVGSVAGQLAKAAGCRVVGIAGGGAKCDYVVGDLGFDACVDHKSARFEEDLRKACPQGVDAYFDNVGGPILDALLAIMRPFSRIVVCGTISDANAPEPYRHRNLRSILVNRVRMQGMIVFDWKERYGEALTSLAGMLAEGRLKYRESIAEGLENAPQAFISMLAGGNFGKQLVKLS